MRVLFLCTLLICSIRVFSQQHTLTQQAAIDLFTQNKDAEAIVMFQKALAENSSDKFSLNALGVIYNRGNRYEEEYESSGKGMSVTDNKGQPFIIQHAESGIELGKFDEALKLMEGLVTQDETLPFMPMAHFLRGRALDGLGRVQEAIGAYSKSIQLKSEFSSPYYYRGDDFNNISRYADALKDFNSFINLVNDYAPAYNDRAIALYKLGRNNDAIADYTKSITLNPSYYIAFCNRGDLYMELGNTASAKADYQSVLKKTDKYAGAYWGMANVLRKEKSFTEALSMAEKAITMKPGMPAYLATYGFILINLDRDKEAIAYADRIIAINDKNSDGWILKSVAYSNLKDFDSGIRTLTTGIEKIPDNYMLYGLRANIYRSLHNDAAAIKDDEKAKELSTK